MLYVHQSFLEAKPIFAGDFLPQKPTPDFTVDKLQKGRKEKILVNTNSYGFELDTVKRTKSLKTRVSQDPLLIVFHLKEALKKACVLPLLPCPF